MNDENRWACPRCRGKIVLPVLEIAEIEGLISEAQVLIAKGKGPASPGTFLEKVLEILDAAKKRNTAR